ncbi:MAG: HipA N-terminal domain-containing protein [Coriobacteriales bacterium]|nr:HipA N-terminal domain-containing protein [Coriobacteriales bacterium]
MAELNLLVTIQGVPCGTVRQDESDIVSFAYLDGYEGIPLSLSMPITNRTYGQQVVSPYLFGLLPDNENQRRALAREYDVRPNNPVTLLWYIGRDCPGAVQFYPCDKRGHLVDRQMRVETYRPLSNHEIALRLKGIRANDEDSWVGRNESWSLGGNQGKFAFIKRIAARLLGTCPVKSTPKTVGQRLQMCSSYSPPRARRTRT